MYYFCTYFDKNYLAQGIALYESLINQLNANFTLYILSLDEGVENFFKKNPLSQVVIIQLLELESFYPELLKIKSERKIYEYYFSLSPTLPSFILANFPQVDMITGLDADIYFFSSPEILFEELGNDSVYIIPHFFSEENKDLEIYGKYNVVFNTFKRDESGLKCLEWWRERCLEWCFDYVEDEKFADQKYLDQFPLKFDGVKIAENRGANLANFNIDHTLIQIKKGKFYANNNQLVFFHFQGLRPISMQVFNPNFLDIQDYRNRKLIKIYVFYLKRIIKIIKRFKLSQNLSERLKTKIQPSQHAIRDYLIYKHSIAIFSFYKGYVHLLPYYNFYKKLKSIFNLKKNG